MQKASGARGHEGGMQANCAGQLEVPVFGHAAVLFLNENTLSCYQSQLTLELLATLKVIFF